MWKVKSQITRNPLFGKKKCEDYFKSAFKSLSPRRLFVIPSWIPRFKEPEHSFDTSVPIYAEITRIIRKIKSKGSSCPLDQISIILFKRSPYAQSYITSVIQKIWEKGKVPKTWKKAVTVLIYKSGETDIPSNFRPITLEIVH